MVLDAAVVAGRRTGLVRLCPPPLPARKDKPAEEAAAEPAAEAEAAPAEAAGPDAGAALSCTVRS